MGYKKPRRILIYKGKEYTYYSLADRLQTTPSAVSQRLRNGWTIAQLLGDESRIVLDPARVKAAQKKNMPTMRCKCCGMEFAEVNKKRFCDRVCINMYHQHPGQFGQWWQE